MCSVKRRLEPLDDGLEDLEAGKRLVVGFDQRPGRDLGARAIDEVAHRRLVRVPLLAIAPVVGRDLEALERRLLALAEAAKLLGFADLKPELDDDRAAVDELLLELVDLVVRAHPVGSRAIAFDPLDQHAAIPGAVEY